MYNKLDWDSEFFGLDVYRIHSIENSIDIENDLAKIKNRQHCLIYLYLRPDQVRIIDYCRNNAWLLADQKVTFLKSIENEIQKVSNEIEIFSVDIHNQYIPELYELAYLSGEYSRFRIDENVPDHKFRELYKRWIDNTINKTYGEQIFLSFDGKELMGMATINRHKSQGQIGLIAVKEYYQGKSIGKKLLQAAENYALNSGITMLNIPTQKKNFVACNFYKKCGYKILSEEIIFHIWKH